jgi:hypothetical protein
VLSDINVCVLAKSDLRDMRPPAVPRLANGAPQSIGAANAQVGARCKPPVKLGLRWVSKDDRPHQLTFIHTAVAVW